MDTQKNRSPFCLFVPSCLGDCMRVFACLYACSRFNTEHEVAKKLQERVYDLQAQSRYSSAILNRLGLSILSTASVPDARLRKRQGAAKEEQPGQPEDEAGLEAEREEIFASTTRLSDFVKALLSEQKRTTDGDKQGLLALPVDRAGSHGADLSPEFFDFASPGSGGFRGLVFPDVDQVKPLAYAMLSDVLA